MSARKGSALDFIELLQRKAPAYLDLITAQSDDDFERAFDALLEMAVTRLETNKKNFERLNEEGLSGALALALSMPGLSVTQEANSNGHVDLTIEAVHCKPVRKKLGEAKMYAGPAYHFGGLAQLLGRYTTGREGRGLLVVYFRKKDIAGLVQKLRAQMNEDLPCLQQGDSADHSLRWAFLSKHAHCCGETLEVGHVGCNLYLEPVTPLTDSES